MESLDINLSFWSGKKVFLTGHTGFKGSWLSLWLQKLGAEVTGYSLLPPTEPNLFELADIAQGMHSIIGDIRNGENLTLAMGNAESDIVIHMAAQPLVRYSYVDPETTYSTNVMGTVNLLEAVRKTQSVRAVLNVTSDKCYENKEWLWSYRENEAIGGFDPYSSSKGCSELITAAYRNSFFNSEFLKNHQVALATARAGNVIGGGDWAVDRLIPDMLRAITENRPCLVRNPNSVRPWQHVLEPLSGYLKLAQKLYQQGSDYAEGWNFGPNDEDAKPVHWIVENFTQKWGDRATWKLDEIQHPHEAHYLKLDCSKARMRLDWQPKWSLTQALTNIINWHKAHQRGDDMREFTLKQISVYQENKAQ
jgi:CDP-glucose 4,6-dehydratase